MNTENNSQEENKMIRRVRFLETPPAFIRKPLTLVNGNAYAAVWVFSEIIEENQSSDTIDNKDLSPVTIFKRERYIIRSDGVVYGEIEAEGIKPLKDLRAKVELPFMPKVEKLWSAKGLNRYIQGDRPDPIVTFHKIVDVIDTFIDFSRSLSNQRTTCEMVACYIMATWFSDAFNVLGYLWPNGQKGSGKSQLLSLIADLSYLGEFILAGSSYATLRDLAGYGATLAFDDAENLSDPHNYDSDKRALLLAGNRKGSQVALKVLIGKKWQTVYVNTYCPRLFSAINIPDPVLASRTIILPLIRTNDDFKNNSDPLDYEYWPHDRKQLLDDLWSLGLFYLPVMSSYSKRVPLITELKGRNLEPWRAILSVAVFLEDMGEIGIAQRMAELAWKYNNEEKINLQGGDLTMLLIKAIGFQRKK